MTFGRNRLDNDALADIQVQKTAKESTSVTERNSIEMFPFFQGFVERIPGVTTLVKDPTVFSQAILRNRILIQDPVTGDLRARSGNQAVNVNLP